MALQPSPQVASIGASISNSPCGITLENQSFHLSFQSFQQGKPQHRLYLCTLHSPSINVNRYLYTRLFERTVDGLGGVRRVSAKLSSFDYLIRCLTRFTWRKTHKRPS